MEKIPFSIPISIRKLPASPGVYFFLGKNNEILYIGKATTLKSRVRSYFAGNLAEAKAFLDFGFTVSFTGVITFTRDYDEIIKNIPLEMIMSETDSPYVAPAPRRGQRNEPSYVKEVVKRIAEIKNLPEKEVAEAVVANARRVFKI